MAYMGPAFNTFDVNFNFDDLVLDANDVAENGDLLQYDVANAQWLTVSNLTIPGNLIVNGTTTTVNSTTITVDDPVFTLGGDTAPTSDDNKDRGIEFRWHDGANAKVGFFGFDNGTGQLTYIPDATNTGEVFSGTPGSVLFSDATFSGNTAIKIPVGGTADRPTALQGHMRYNTDTSQFEGYDGANWSGLGGLIDVDQDTYITAEETTDADTLKMYTGGSLAVTVGSDQNVSFDSTGAIVVPVGTTAQRPGSLAQGMIRYNTDDSTFEGYDGGAWGSLGGVKDVDQDTYIEAEQSADDDTLRFYTAGVERMTIDGTGNINFNGGLELGLQATITGEITTTATTQVALDNWGITEYRTAKYMLQAIDVVSSEYHISELMVVHNGTSAFATEYGTIHTGANPLASYDVDVNSNNVRLLATPASTNNTNFKFSRNALTPEPTFALGSSSASINEGDAVTFTLTTTQVSNGSTVPYTITGIQSADLSVGSLTGNFTVNNNTATNAFTLSADATTEGAETLTLALDNGLASSAVTIGDTSLDPTYTLSADNTTINEGASVVITLTTTDVPDATNIAYTVTGVDTDDLTAGTLTGNFTIASNTATATFTLAEDTTTEGDETLTLTLDNGSGNIAITITDSSTTPANNTGTTATLAQTLVNPNPDSTSAGDKFGYGAAIAGDYAIVGAYGEGTGVTADSGKAYVYNVADGSLVYTLNNPNAYSTEGGDRFGYAVGISTTHAIVGAYQEDDAQGTTSGKAYVFDLSNGSLAYTLDNPNPVNAGSSGSSDDHFGKTVGIGTTHAIVGAPQEWKSGADPSFRASGKAYIFDLSNGSLAYTLDNPNAYGTTDYDLFGDRVAISDTYAIVSTAMEDDAGGTYSGKAYIYDLSNGSLTYTLDNPNPSGTSANDYFGISCAISDTHAIVGAYGEEDSGGSTSGKAYIYTLSNGNLLHTVDNPNAYNTSQGDNFGGAVGISDTYALVSAPSEDDAQGGGRGKAYIFKISDGSLLATIDNPNTSSLYNPLGDKAAGITDTHAILGSSDYDDSGGSSTDSSGRAFIYNITTTSGGASTQVTPALPANSGGLSTSFADDGQIATNGTYTVVGDPRMNIGTINQPGWAWIYKNSDGSEMASFNSILDGHAPNDSSLNSRDGNGNYASSKYHKMYFGQRVAINDTYAFVTAPIAYSSGESNWGNGADGGGQYGPGGQAGAGNNAYVSVIRLSDMTHVRTIKMDANMISSGPSYAAGGTNWGSSGIAATNDWLALGATGANVGPNVNSDYAQGAIEIFDITDADPANWTSDRIDNMVTTYGQGTYSGNYFNFGYGIAIEGNKLASNFMTLLQTHSYDGTNWVSGVNNTNAFPNQNNNPNGLVIKDSKIYASRTTGSPNYNAYLEQFDFATVTVQQSQQITEGNGYPGYELAIDGDYIYTSDSGYTDDNGNANAGRIMRYALDTLTHDANYDTESKAGQGAANNYYGQTFAIGNGYLISKEQNPTTNPTTEYLTVRNLTPASGGGSASADGFIAKNNFTGMSNERFYQVSTDTSNNFFCTGHDAVDDNILIAKYDSAGAFQWARTAGGQGTAGDRIYGSSVDSSGNVLSGGYSYGNGVNGASPYPALITKYQSDGTHVYTKVFTDGGTFSWIGQATVVDSNDNFYITGRGRSQSSNSNDYTFVAKLDSAGVMQWIRKLDHTGDSSNGRGITVDNNDDVIVAATMHEDISGYGYSSAVVIKLSKTDGSLIWYKIMKDPDGANGSHGESFMDVAVDSNNDIYATGYQNYQMSGTYTTPVVKFSGTDGSVIWKKRHTNSGGAPNIGVVNDNVYVVTDNNKILIWDTSGTLTGDWEITATTGTYYCEGVHADQNGNAVIAGFYYSPSSQPFPFFAKLPATISAGTFDDFIITAGTLGEAASNLVLTTFATMTSNAVTGITVSDAINMTPNTQASSLNTVTPITGASGGGSSSLAWGGTRGFLIGGNANGARSTNIEYLNIQNPGNASNFGDLVTAIESHTSGGNKTRGITNYGTISGQSYPPGWSTGLEYFTCATLGNASSFGNRANRTSVSYCVADGTKVIWAGGQGGTASGSYNNGNNFIDYVTADTTGDSVDFGDMTQAKHSGGSTNDDTRGVFISGLVPGAYTNVIDYITMATPGNAIDFGDLHNGDGSYAPSTGVVSNNTIGVIAGGMFDSTYNATDAITKITIQTPGNSSDFGDLTVAKERQAATTDGITGIFANGYQNTPDNSIVKITIATPGNATDFGDTVANTNGQHSGMSGNAS